MKEPKLPDFIGENSPVAKDKFTSRVNAITPLLHLGAACACIGLTMFQPSLWESQGFILTIGSLLGSSATGALTQKDG